MIALRTDFVAAPRAWAAALAVASALLALAACDQFDTEKIADVCVASALKNGEPFGNPKERAQAEEQFRQYCAAAAKRQR
jgi:hypothetical protein